MFSSAHLTHTLLIRLKFAKVSLLLILNAASSVTVAGDSISLSRGHEGVSRVTRSDETCAPLDGVTATEVQSSGWSVWRRAGRGGSHGRGGGGCWHSWRDTVSRCHARPRDGASHLRVIPGRGGRLQVQVAGRPVSGITPPLPVSPGLPAPIPRHPITTLHLSFVWCLLQSLGKPWEGIRSPRKVGLRTFLFLSFPSVVFN